MMSKKNKNYTEKNPFLMVLYMIAAAALIGCLIWLVLCSQKQKAEYEETLARMAEDETEYVREFHQAADTETDGLTAAETDEVMTETESSSELIGELSSEMSGGETEEAPETAAAEETKNTSETSMEETAETESETETETSTRNASVGLSKNELVLSNVKDTAIIVLNGTERSGVAGYWAGQLEDAGYTNVTAASYHQVSGEQTTIYTDNELCAEELKEIFPDAAFETGVPSGSYTLGDSEEEPEGEIEVYIIIGTADEYYAETA